MKETPIDSHRVFYNRRWESDTFIKGGKLQRCLAILEAIASTGSGVPPNIIELGCGRGWLTNILGTIGPSTGVDLSDVAMHEASRRYSHLDFIAADILDWEYPPESFDIVISHEVLEHVEDQESYLEVARGLLRKGGFLILTMPNRPTSEALSDEEIASYELQPIEKWLTLSELKAKLSPRFRIVRITTIMPGFGVKGIYRIVSSRRLRSVLNRLHLLWIYDTIALRCGFGLHLLAIAEKE
jgi:SAM-dependent methyltransferase